MSAGAERRAHMPCAIQIAGSIRPSPRYADLVSRTTGNPSSDPPIASAMAHLHSRTVGRCGSVFASVIETAFIESCGRRNLAHEVAAQPVDQLLQVRMLLQIWSWIATRRALS